MGKKIFILVFLSLVTLTFFLIRGSNARYLEETYTEILEYNSNEEETFNSDTLSILSFNIGFLSGLTNNEPIRPDYSLFQNNLGKSIQQIQQINPDFIGFQEIDFESKRTYYQNQLDSIARKSEYRNGAKAVNWDKRYIPFPYWPPKVHYGRMLSGQAVLSKYPIVSNERIVLDKPSNNPFYYNAFYIDRLIQIVTVKIDEKTLILMNVHLEAYDKETRRIQAEVLIEQYRLYADKYPVILMGDFNASPEPDSEDPSIIDIFQNEPGLSSAISFDQYQKKPEDYYTFSSEDPYQMIDYIFYNNEINPIESRVVQEFGMVSDHYPVFFRFTFSNESEN